MRSPTFPIETREKWFLYATRVFLVISAFYCKLLSLNFVQQLRVRALRTYKKLNRYCYSELEESSSSSELEESSSTCWPKQVPEDIMQSILQKLCIFDYDWIGAVCRSWKDSVNMSISGTLCSPAPQLPWLMLSFHPISTQDNFFLSLIDQQVYKPNRKHSTHNMNRLDCVGSIEGWLIMVDNALWRPEAFIINNNTVRFFFLNPVSKARVMLPSSKSTLPCKCSSKTPSFVPIKASASSIPTSQHCFVASLCSRGHVAFCRPIDQSWTLVEAPGEGQHARFCDIEILDGKLYAATKDALEFLTVIQIQDANDGGPPTYTIERLVVHHSEGIVPPLFLETRRMNGIVEQISESVSLAIDSKSKELFMVLHRTEYKIVEDPTIPWYVISGTRIQFESPPRTQGFRVFKLEQNTEGLPQWAEVVDLGDRILFMSKAGNKLIPASNDLKNTGLRDKTLEKDCIYFAYDSLCLVSPRKGYDVGVFSFTNKNIKRFNFPHDHPGTILYTRPVWFTPSPW
ncbi:hypothetical protein PS1_029582 [Malus domestica]